MSIRCIIPSDIQKTLGYTEPFVNAVRRATGKFSSPNHSRNVARNLGTQDDISVNLTKDNGKKVFGKNLTDASEWQSAVAKENGVPNNVLVTVPSLDGVSRAFMSNKQTKSFPSKWINDNGNIVPNPDWDMITPNQTLDATGAPTAYVRESDRVYRPAREGEIGDHFLNVQNPVRKGQGIDKDYIVENNVDAYDLGGGRYELIHESQAIPTRHANKKPDRGAIHTEQIDTALTPSQVEEKLMNMGNIAPRAAMVAAGGVVGSLTDPDNDWGGTWYGGALGFALGSPAVRTKAKGLYGKVTGKGKDAYDEAAHNAYQHDKKVARAEDLRRRGFDGDPDSRLAERFDEKASKPYREALNNGDTEGMFGAIFRNNFFESGRNLLDRQGSPTAVQLKAAFESLENTPKILYREFTSRFNEAFGTQDGIQAFRQEQVRFVRDFYSEMDVPEQQAKDSFGAAVRRIITHGGRVEGGRFVFDDTITANNTYAQQVYREFDQALLQDESGQAIVNATRDAGDGISRRIVDALHSSIEREISGRHFNSNYREFARRITQYDGSLKDYIDEFPNTNIGGKKRTTAGFLRQARSEDPNFSRVMEMKSKMQRMKEMEGRYFPQKWDTVKAHRAKQEWLRNNDDTVRFVEDPNFQGDFRQASPNETPTHTLSEISPQAQNFYWNKRIGSEILENHRDKWKFFEFDETGSDVRVKRYNTYDKARKALRSEIEHNTDEAIAEQLRRDITNEQNIDDYINSFTRNGNTYYELQTPPRLREQGINVFGDANSDLIGKSIDNLRVNYVTRKSNHFDRPRNYVLPERFLQTDLDRVIRSYTNDVGKRLASIQNDMYDEQMFARKMNQIRREIGDKQNRTDVDDSITKMKSWYKMMQGMYKDIEMEASGLSMKAESQKELIRDSLLNTLGKFATATFMYATAFYAPLQMAVLGPFLFGWKNTFRAYKTAVTNPQELRRMTQELRTTNNIYESVGMMSPEHNSAYRRSQFGEYLPDWLNKFSEYGDKLHNFSINFNLTKPIVEGLGGNMDDLGVMRLFGGSLLDVSGAEASLASLGAMRHVEDLTAAMRRLQQSGEDTTRIGRTRYSTDQIRRELEEFGIDNVDEFMSRKDSFDNYVQSLKGGTQENVDPWMYDQMTQVLSNSVDMYHGRSKLVRPLAWLNNPFGRMFSQFATYTQNFGVRVTRERIYRPFRDWESRHGGSVTEGNADVPVFKLAVAASTGNDRLFRETFGENWEQAYNDFPVQAVNNFFKVFGALGVGKAMLITRAGFMDLTEILANEAIGNDDFEAWSGVNRQASVGYDQVSGEHITISDVFGEGRIGYGTMVMTRAAIEDAIRLGFGGPVVGKMLEELQYNNGIGQSFPIASTAQNIFDKLSNIYKAPIQDKPYTMAREISDFGLLMTPPLGTFNGFRQQLLNGVFQKPKNRDNQMLDQYGNVGEINIIDN